MIDLGDKVKDKVSGYVGIAVCRSSYLQGCDRISIQAIVKKNEKPLSWQSFDEPQLKVLKKCAVKQGNKITGGWKPDSAEKNF